jgi:sulfane dehydrogenase subunit SoxC
VEGLSVKTPDGIQSGRVQKAPENFLDRDGISTVIAESKAGRRNFIRSAFAAAAAGAAAPVSYTHLTLPTK